MSQYIVSARKYRPDSFETLIGQDNIARTLKNSILRGQLAHAYLFCGPRGVGKTSTARIFAKTINCSNPGPEMEPCGECESCVSFREGRSYCIHELDAASNNGVDDIKALMDQVQIPPQVGRYSVYIIDEVHMLSQAAFNAFLKTLEEPPAHAIFILATTEKHKILPTILSRCQTYDFNRISVGDIVLNLRGIAQKESITVDDESLHIIAQKADGAMRDALTIFDQTVAFCGTDIHYEDVIRNLNVLDYEYSFRLVDAFRSGDYATAMLTFDEILAKGFNAQHFISALSSHLRDLIVSRTAGLEALLDLPQSLKLRYRDQAEACTLQFLYDALGITTQCEAGYKAAINQRLHIEFALMKLSFLKSGVPVPAASPAASSSAAMGPAGSRTASAASQASLGPSPATCSNSAQVNAAATNEVGGTAPENCATLGNIRGRGPSSDGRGPAQQDVLGGSTPDGMTATAGGKPEPRRRTARTGAALSLNALMEEKDEVKVEESVAATVKPEDLTDELIEAKWRALAEVYNRQPRLASAITTARLEVVREDGLTVTAYVANESQRAWIEANRRHEIEGLLHKSLGCEVHLVIAAEQFVEEKMIYTPEDKAKCLMEQNPEVIDIITDLGLDIK